MTSKNILCVVSVLGLMLGAQTALAASAAVREMARIVMHLEHYPSDADKKTLKGILDNTGSTGQERVLATAISNSNLQHRAAAEDMDKLKKVKNDAAAPAEVRDLASILLTIMNHNPSFKDKNKLKHILCGSFIVPCTVPGAFPYHALDSGGLVPIPDGFRAAARPNEFDPESETVVLFESGNPAEQVAAGTPKAGRIIVEVMNLGDSEREDPAYITRLEALLHKKAAARVGKITVGRVKDEAYPGLSFREKDPSLVQVYIVTPKRLVKISAEFWTKAAAQVAAGYKDGP